MEKEYLLKHLKSLEESIENLAQLFRDGNSNTFQSYCQLDLIDEYISWIIQQIDNEKEIEMDKKIRSIEKKIKRDTKSEEKSLKQLEKMDKRRDKFVHAGKKAMKGKC